MASRPASYSAGNICAHTCKRENAKRQIQRCESRTHSGWPRGRLVARETTNGNAKKQIPSKRAQDPLWMAVRPVIWIILRGVFVSTHTKKKMQRDKFQQSEYKTHSGGLRAGQKMKRDKFQKSECATHSGWRRGRLGSMRQLNSSDWARGPLCMAKGPTDRCI